MTTPPLHDAPQKDISKQVIAGASWLISMRWGGRLIGLVSTMVLARLLTPNDFGIVAIATSYIGIILGVSSLNISQAIIQFKEVDHSVYDTSWTLGIIRGVILAVIILISAIPLANIMNEPRLILVVVALSASSVITGFENPYFVAFEKNLQFSKLVILEIATKVAAVSTTITLAIIFQNYWALIGGMIVSTLLRVILSFILRPERPHLSLVATRKLFGFTVWLSGNRILTEVNTRFFNFVIGAVVGVAPTGKFHMSMELSDLVNEFQGPLARVVYSAYSKMNDNIERLIAAYVTAASIVFSLVLPAGVGLALVSRDFILLVLGEQWLSIAPYFAIFCVMIGLTSIVSTVDSLLISLGRQKQVFYRELVLSGVTLIGISVAVFYGSLMAFVIARFVSGLSWGILSQYFVQRDVGNMVGRMLIIRNWRVVISVLSMVLLVNLLQDNIAETLDYRDTMIRLAVSIFVGAISYLGVLLALWRISGKPDGTEEWMMKNILHKIMPRKKFN